MFFWQASEEVEEERQIHLFKADGKPRISGQFMRNLRLDNFIGMLFSGIGAWSIIVVAATVLNSHGITDIKTAANTAKALEPLVNTFDIGEGWFCSEKEAQAAGYTRSKTCSTPYVP